MNNRPIASLTPTLLARKGAARPAMRPQIQPLRAFHDNSARQLDDLGWNDMGSDAPEAAPAPVEQPAPPVSEIATISPAAEPPRERVGEPVAEPTTEVARLQEKIAERIAARPKGGEKEASATRRSALAEGRRAAFTLRLDSERHLRLRLACVTSNRSAQQIVTEALDRLIAELPDVAELAAKVRKGR